MLMLLTAVCCLTLYAGNEKEEKKEPIQVKWREMTHERL